LSLALFAVKFSFFYRKVRQVEDAKKRTGKKNNNLDIFSYLELTLSIIIKYFAFQLEKRNTCFIAKAKTSKSKSNSEDQKLQQLIKQTVRLWRQNHLTYDQAGYVAK
jgi:hypothetical protein